MIQEPWLDWLISNSRNKTHFNAQTTWYTIFVVCLWQIWKNRNQKKFQQIMTLNHDSVKLIWSYAKEINQALTWPLLMLD